VFYFERRLRGPPTQRCLVCREVRFVEQSRGRHEIENGGKVAARLSEGIERLDDASDSVETTLFTSFGKQLWQPVQ
jgi:hypothetical protein